MNKDVGALFQVLVVSGFRINTAADISSVLTQLVILNKSSCKLHSLLGIHILFNVFAKSYLLTNY